MKTFPMFIKTSNRSIVIIGGGEEAVRKARLVLKTDAKIIVLGDEFDPEFEELAQAGRVELRGMDADAGFEDAALVFIATGDLEQDQLWRACAKSAGAIVNVVDRPDLCDAYTPSIVDRDPLVVAIGSEGDAPVLARQIKSILETTLEPHLGRLVAFAGQMRGRVEEMFEKEKRRALWAWVFAGAPRKLFASGQEAEAEELIRSAIEAGAIPEEALPPIALVGAGPGAADLLTLRAVKRLQEADIIFYDRLVDPSILELARRDAERVYVGKMPGGKSWAQEKISEVLVAAGKTGQSVVRLKSGDPGIFGRGSEEIEAIENAGLSYEIVPGITAAIAASAATGRMLTERGEIDTVVVSSGQLKEGDEAPEWSYYLRPGASLSVYMGIKNAPDIQRHLLERGLPKDLPIDITSRVYQAGQSHHVTTISELLNCIHENSIQAPAIVTIRYPKSFQAH